MVTYPLIRERLSNGAIMEQEAVMNRSGLAWRTVLQSIKDMHSWLTTEAI